MAEWARRVDQRCFSVKGGIGNLAYMPGANGYTGPMKKLPTALISEKENGVRPGMLGLSPEQFPKEMQERT